MFSFLFFTYLVIEGLREYFFWTTIYYHAMVPKLTCNEQLIAFTMRWQPSVRHQSRRPKARDNIRTLFSHATVFRCGVRRTRKLLLLLKRTCSIWFDLMLYLRSDRLFGDHPARWSVCVTPSWQRCHHMQSISWDFLRHVPRRPVVWSCGKLHQSRCDDIAVTYSTCTITVCNLFEYTLHTVGPFLEFLKLIGFHFSSSFS